MSTRDRNAARPRRWRRPGRRTALVRTPPPSSPVPQAIAAEARTLAHPVSFEVVSSSKADGIEDRTTMAPLSARRLAEMADLAARVVSLELFVAAQAIDLRRPSRLGEGTGQALRLVRELADFIARGQVPPGRPRATCRCGPGRPVRRAASPG